MCHIRHINTGKYGMISNYMITNYLNCLQKAATPLAVNSGRQWQAAANFPNVEWHSALQTKSRDEKWSSAMLGHAGIRNGICQIFHLGARGSSGRGGIGLKGVEARESRGSSFCFILLGKRVAETPLPPYHSRDEIVETPLHYT